LGDTDWISGEDRCKLCKLAIAEEKLTDFISVAKGEVQSTSGFVDFPEVTITLAEFLNEKLYGTDKLLHHSLKVVYVCGLDHFNKCPSVAWLAKKENIACAVIYRRGAPDARIKKLEEESSNIYYITLEAERDTLVDISSTAIRERYRNPNAEDSNDLTYSFVHDFLQKKYCEK
jgi:nicotinic acid mononucleotide adenylyltransferase